MGSYDRLTFKGEAERITLPLAIDRRVPRWLPTVARVGGHDHCFDSTPLTEDLRHQDLETLFDTMAGRGIDILRWRRLPMDTAFAATLATFLENAGLACEATKTYRRPLLVPDGRDPDSFLKSHLSKKRLKDIQRRRQRLSEMGSVEFLAYQGPHDAAQWCGDFLELEASGWKGPSGTGTAIACSPAERAFFEAVAAEGAANGRIVVHSLTLDGKPVAMTVNFRSGTWIWAYKVAYCEDLTHLSPGVQLEVEGSRAFLSDPSLACVDSCTTSEQGVMARLWPGRRPMAELLVAVHPRANRAVRIGGHLWRRFHTVKGTARELILSRGRVWPLLHRSAGG
jgi:CelD/BcsL family acetyltransferase involved in cellulose biosynthesis